MQYTSTFFVIKKHGYREFFANLLVYWEHVRNLVLKTASLSTGLYSQSGRACHLAPNKMFGLTTGFKSELRPLEDSHLSDP